MEPQAESEIRGGRLGVTIKDVDDIKALLSWFADYLQPEEKRREVARLMRKVDILWDAAK